MKAFKFILFIVLFVGAERICHKLTHGFRLSNIYSNLPTDPARETSPLTEQEMASVRSLLSQPYTFLDSGGESYAFVSEDGEYVLKFFKHHHMCLHSWMDPILPQKEIDRRKMRFNRFFKSCKLAYEVFRKETGLIFVHLSKSDDLNIQLTIFDPNHIAHQVNLNELEFALQKKVSMAAPIFADLAETGQLDIAKARLDTLVELIVHRCEVGLADHDAQLRNFGFLDDEVISVDLGCFSFDETLKNSQGIQRTLLHESAKMRKWIKTTYPELEAHLNEKIEKEFSNKVESVRQLPLPKGRGLEGN